MAFLQHVICDFKSATLEVKKWLFRHAKVPVGDRQVISKVC